MTPSEFRTLAQQIAGELWRTRLPAMIGRSRSQVYWYACGRDAVPEVVQKLMRELAKS